MNLRLIDIELLECLPTRGKQSDFLKNFKPYRRQEYGYGRMSDSKQWRKAQSILYGSVGEDADLVLNKMRNILKGISQEQPEQVINHLVDVAIIIDDEKYLVGYYGRPDAIITGPYIDIDGKINYHPYKRRSRGRWNAREHYSKLTERKRRSKNYRLERKQLGDILIKMINRPELFQLYTKLVKEKKFIYDCIFRMERELKESNDGVRPAVRGKFWSYWRKKYHPLRIKEEKQKLIPIQYQLDQLEAGNYKHLL
jgi:hypothetical protein